MSVYDDCGDGSYVEDMRIARVQIRNLIDGARRCLNRPERGPSEAIIHLEAALKILHEVT